MFDIPRLVVAAPQGRSGKTLVSVGLCAALSGRGTAIQPFKRGPDYIDPSWLTAAAGHTCRNLDVFLMGETGVRQAFLRPRRPCGDLESLDLIEGAMGLFDGLGRQGEGSTAHVARLLGAPILLIVNASRMVRSAAALVRGFQTFEPETVIGGVVFNHVNHARHLARLRAALEHHCGLPVLGALPDDPALTVPQRHLGLIPRGEDETLVPFIAAARRVITENVDLEGVLALARSARPLTETAVSSPIEENGREYQDESSDSYEPATGRPRIGIAQDRAFSFYYPRNLDALREAGAGLVPLDTLADPHLPDVDALYLGGGFPEVFMDELAANTSLREEIRTAIEAGLPTYAECGGLMYLARSLTWGERTRSMVGVLPCDVEMTTRPQGHGYVRLRATGDNPFFPPGSEVRGHEFHHSRLVNAGDVRFAYRVTRGNGVDGQHDGLLYKNVLASYTHLHALGAPGWAAGFVRAASGKEFVICD